MNAVTVLRVDVDANELFHVRDAVGLDEATVGQHLLDRFADRSGSIEIDQLSPAGRLSVQMMFDESLCVLSAEVDGASAPLLLSASTSGPAMLLAALAWSTEVPAADVWELEELEGDPQEAVMSAPWSAEIKWSFCNDVMSVQRLIGNSSPTWIATVNEDGLVLDQFSMRSFLLQLTQYWGVCVEQLADQLAT